MTLRIALCLLAALMLAGNAQANEFIGDLVFCDDNANGTFDEGETALNGVRLDLVCERENPDGKLVPCAAGKVPGWNGNRTTVTTGQPHPSIEDNYDAFMYSCGVEAGYDPSDPEDLFGRYIVRVQTCTEPGVTDTIRCSVEVDESTLPDSCNVLVTPRVDGFPVDGNHDGDWCDPEDGPFPEDQVLGNLPEALGCEDHPDDPPGDGVYYPVVRYAGGDRCSLNNDFGYTGSHVDPCDIAVDLSCIVAEPPATGDICDGGVVEAVFEYVGNVGCDATSNDQEGKVDCSGMPGGDAVSIQVNKDADKVQVSPSNGIVAGTRVSFAATDKKLKSELKFEVGGQELAIHTSCSKPLNLGDQFGSMKLVELTSKDGGTVSLSPTGEVLGGYTSCEIFENGTECEKKPRELSLRYVGGDCTVSNSQSGKVTCSGHAGDAENVRIVVSDKKGKELFLDQVGVNLSHVVTASAGDDDSDKLESDTKVRIFDQSNRLLQTVQFHTSCSKPLRIGDRFGAVEVVGFVNKDQGSVKAGADVTYFYEINPRYTDLYDVTLQHDLLDPMDVPGMSGHHVRKLKPLFFQATAHVDKPGWSTVTLEGETADGQVCTATDSLKITMAGPAPEPFVCKDAKPLTQLSLTWTGPSGANVVTESGQSFANVQNGQEIIFDLNGVGGDAELTVSGSVHGESKFHLSCSDDDMNGPEDCGKLQGNGKKGDSDLLNLWRLEGIAGDTVLDCSDL